MGRERGTAEAVAGTLLDFTEVIRDVVELSMSGLLARQEATEHNA
jgi:hypothetical protein